MPSPEVARRCGEFPARRQEMAQPPVRLDFDMGGGAAEAPTWRAARRRKSAAAVAASARVTDALEPPLCRSIGLIGFARCQARHAGASGDVDLAALRYALAVQEAIDAARPCRRPWTSAARGHAAAG